jgi:hypothetical protein
MLRIGKRPNPARLEHAKQTRRTGLQLSDLIFHCLARSSGFALTGSRLKLAPFWR